MLPLSGGAELGLDFVLDFASGLRQLSGSALSFVSQLLLVVVGLSMSLWVLLVALRTLKTSQVFWVSLSFQILHQQRGFWTFGRAS